VWNFSYHHNGRNDGSHHDRQHYCGYDDYYGSCYYCCDYRIS
jgi:hypothetical protein